MDLNVFERQLRLMELLAQQSFVPAEGICRKLQITRRTLFRYLELFRRSGFEVERSVTGYRLSASSPFFIHVTDRVHFSEEEAITLLNILSGMDEHSSELNYLRTKLSNLANLHILNTHVVDERFASNLHNLYEAIKTKQTVVLHNYCSLKSDTVTDRVVEPYVFLEGNEAVRCFEIVSQKNKTFRLSRIERVDIVPLKWANEARHTAFFTDIFHFSGEEQCHVKLRLNLRAAQLLSEEFPNCISDLYKDKDDDSHWFLDTYVCSYKGIGRFCIGLFEDVTPLGDEEFISFLKKKTENLTNKLFQ